MNLALILKLVKIVGVIVVELAKIRAQTGAPRLESAGPDELDTAKADLGQLEQEIQAAEASDT